MNWRREDFIYAGLTAAALVFVAYLIAGNFGLIPSPLAGARADALAQPDVAAALVANQTSAPSTALPLPAIAPVPTNAPSAPPRTNRHVFGSPSVAIATKSGTTVSVTSPSSVTGTASAPAGARGVSVTFTPSAGTPTTVTAALRCNVTKTKCNWSAPVPDAAGNYSVTATVTDRIGKTGRSGSITITVLNPGATVPTVPKTVEQVGGDTSQSTGNAIAALNDLFGSLHL